MNFIHIKIFANNLDSELVSESLGLTPDFIYRADGDGLKADKQDMWNHTVEAEGDALEGEIKHLISQLDSKREAVSCLIRASFDMKLYFVVAHYVDSYQHIVSIDNPDLLKLAQMGFELVFDIMNL